MKKFRICLPIGLSLLLFGNVCEAAEKSTKEKMLADLDVIRNAFDVGYAPKEWKHQYAGWDLDLEISKAKEKVETSAALNTKEYQRIVRDFFHSTKDYHVSVFFWSTEAASLPFLITSINGKYFVSHIDEEKLSSSAYSIDIGDEIVCFDGKPMDECFQEFKKNEVRNATEATDRGYAEFFFTNRMGIAGHRVPRGPVMVGFKSSNAEKVNFYQLIWTYTPERITNNFNLGDKPNKLKEKSNHDLVSLLQKEVSNRKMLDPLYGLMKRACADKKMAPGTLGARESKIPELGRTWWKGDADNFFHAYLYENEDHRLIGYVRIPHYAAFGSEVEEFEDIIRLFEERADALVIDQLNNPGGVLFFAYAISSLLTDQPLVTPRHRMVITQEDVAGALEIIPILEKISSDSEAVDFMGNSFFGFPVNHQMAQFFLNYFNFIVSEWNAGRSLTKPYYLYSMDHINPHPGTRFTKPILFLINSMDISCGDFVPAIMQDNKRVTLFGSRTAGAGGYVTAMSFPNRFGIHYFSYTGSIAERVDKNPIENIGVTPDITYEITEEDIKSGYQDYAKAINNALRSLLGPPPVPAPIPDSPASQTEPQKAEAL